MGRIQQFTPVRDSLAWELLERFYDDQGPDAWTQNIVPQGSTANCYTADTYAGIVAEFFRDLKEEGNSAPPIIIELGGGSGRFAWQFLNRLFNYHFIDGEECPQFTYLLTDTAQRNIANWSAKHRFQPLIESGVLEFAQLRVEENPVIRTAGGDMAPSELADRPTIIIANYLFDSVPSNLLRVKNQSLEQVSMSLISSEVGFLDQPVTSFTTVTEQFESAPLVGDASGNPLLNSIIQQYVDEAEEDDDFHIVVPEIGFAFLESFMHRTTPLMLLCGGLGYAHPDDFNLGSPFIFDSYFAHYSNFHIFDQLFARYGGASQFQRHRDTDFSCGALILPGKEKWQAIDFTQTHRTAKSYLRDFYPYDAHELSEMIEETITEASVRQVEAWVRFSKYDPAIAEACLPFLFHQIEQGEDAVDEVQLYEMYMEAYRSFFPDGSPVSFDCGLAHLCMKLGFYDEALKLIEQSREEFGLTAQRLFVHSLVMVRLGRMEEARALAMQSLEMDGSFAPTQRLIADKFAPEEEAEHADTDGLDVPYPHLTVGFSDPDVISKSAKILDEAGAVLIDQIISKDLVRDLRNDFDQQVKDWQTSGLGKPNNVGDKRFTVPIRIRGAFEDPAIYANPALINLMTRAMGEKPVLHAFGGVVTSAGARMQHVHREHPLLFNTDPGNANVPLYATTILVPLIDLDEESGGTQYWEGTHKTGKDENWKGESEVVYTPAGSALVLDYRTYHGGMPCSATHGRPLLYYTYAMPWFTDTLAFESHAALGLSDSERKNIPEKHRYLFKFAKRIAD
jgi:tetratricopeptide (TPR) repeat protein